MSNTRELSQLASVISVADETRNIGIGTTTPTSKLHVVGDGYFSGIVTSSGFYVNGLLIGGSISGTDLVGTALSISGISTLGVTSTTNLTSQTLNVSGVSTLAGKIVSGNGIGNTNISNTLNYSSSSGITAFRPISLVDSAAGIKISRNAGQSNGAALELQTWDVGIVTNYSYWDVNAENGYFGIRDRKNSRSRIFIDDSGSILLGANSATFSNNYAELVGVGTDKVLNVLGNSYISGSVGIGTTNATSKLTVQGDVNVSGVVTATTFVGALTGTASSTTNIPNLTGAITSNNTTTSLGSFTSAQLATSLTDETGSGSAVFATSPTLVTPVLGSATATSIVVGSGVTINASGIVASAGIITASQLSTGASGTGININTDTISGPATLTIDPAAVGDNTGAVRIKGDLYVDGDQFIVNSTTIELADFNVGIATTVGTNALLDGAGIGIGSASIRKTIQWANGTSSLKSSENFNLNIGKTYKINGTDVLSNTTLGSGVTNSSLTSVGTLGSLSVGNVNSTGIVTASTFSGALTGTATSTTNIPNLTGDITSVNKATTLATVNSNVGTFGSGGAIPTITVNAKGLVTGVTTTAVTSANDGALTLAVSGTGLSGSASFTANQAGASSFTVTSNATNANTVSTIVARDASGNFSAGTITASLTGTATSTTNIPNLTGAITSNNTTTSLGSFSSANLATALTDETGSGANVFATSPTLVTPVLGAATATSIVVGSGVTINASGINVTGVITATSGFSGNASSATYATNAGVSTSVIGGIGSITQLQVTGVSTFTNGPILVGTATSTGTASQRLQVSGGAYVSGSVGIGTTNPTSTLTVSGNTLVSGMVTGNTFRARGGVPGSLGVNNNGYGFFGSGDNDSGMYSSTDGQIEFYSNNTEAARITANRNLLIGATTETGTASQRLQVSGGAYVSGRLGVANTNPSYDIDVTGSVGITTTSGDVLLLSSTLSNGRTSIILNTNGNDWELGSRGSGASPINSFYIYDRNASAYRQVIDPSGNVLLGGATATTGTASQPLQVTGGAYVSGSVGIGTTNPVSPLQVVGVGSTGGIRIGTLDFFPFASGNPGSGSPTFRNSTPNSQTVLRVIPNGTGTAQFEFFGKDYYADINAWDNFRVFATGTSYRIDTSFGTTGTIRPIVLETGVSSAGISTNPNQLYLSTNGNIGIGTSIPVGQLQVSSGPVIIGAATSTGTALQRLQVTGGAYVSGDLGVGVTNPGAKLDVTGDIRLSAADPEIEFNSGGPRLKVPSANQLSVHTGGGLNSTSNEVIRINNTGVGIGTINPTVALQLSPNASISNLNGNTNFGTTAGAAATVAQFYHNNGNASYLRIKATRNTAGADWTTASTKLLQVIDVTEMGYIEYNPNGANFGMAFGQGGSEWARFLLSGNLGVGRTNPTSKLEVLGTIAAYSADTTSVGSFSISNAGLLDITSFKSTGGTLRFVTANTSGTNLDRGRVDSSGNFIIGSTLDTGTASQPLQVTGGAYISGNLGIGVTNPSFKLDVSGLTAISNSQSQLLLHQASNTPTVIHRNDGSDYYILLSDNSTTPNITWNALRPLSITLSTGRLNSNNGQYFTGNTLIGSATSTGTASQPLQVTGGAYVSGNLGVGVTAPAFKADIAGDARVTSTNKMRFGGTAGTTNFYIQYNSTANSLDFVAG